jgi:single-strand DNA-binding protein
MSKTNHVQLIGNIGSDLMMHTTESGSLVLNFSLATNHVYTDVNGNKQKSTEWHSIVAFGKIAENINTYLKKGSKLLVLGHLQTRTFQDKKEVTHYRTEVVANDVLYLDARV